MPGVRRLHDAASPPKRSEKRKENVNLGQTNQNPHGGRFQRRILCRPRWHEHECSAVWCHFLGKTQNLPLPVTTKRRKTQHQCPGCTIECRSRTECLQSLRFCRQRSLPPQSFAKAKCAHHVAFKYRRQGEFTYSSIELLTCPAAFHSLGAVNFY